MYSLLTIQANFSSSLNLIDLRGPENEDCKDVSDLAYHIITKRRFQKRPNKVFLQKKLKMMSRGEEFSLEPNFSLVLVDFFEACTRRDIGLLLNVS
jgi:hypothetical protein